MASMIHLCYNCNVLPTSVQLVKHRPIKYKHRPIKYKHRPIKYITLLGYVVYDIVWTEVPT